MSDESRDSDALQELEMLLPFHATGRLTPADAARAERHFSDHPDRLQIVNEEKYAVVDGNEAISAGRAHNFARVAQAISATPVQPSGRGGGLLIAIRRFFELPSAPSVRWAAAVAAVLIVVQAAAIAALVVTQSSSRFSTASGGAASREPGSFVTVRFADGATAAAIAAMLTGLDMRLVDGPAGGGLFTVRIGERDMSDAARDQAIASLRARSDLVVVVMRLR